MNDNYHFDIAISIGFHTVSYWKFLLLIHAEPTK